MKKFSFNNYIAKLVPPKPKAQYVKLINPERDWSVVLLSFFILLLLLFIGSSALFLSINAGDLFATEQESDVPAQSIDRTLLASVLKRLEQRELEFQILLDSGVQLVDPS